MSIIKNAIDNLTGAVNPPTDNILSYASVLKNRNDFRKAGTRDGDDFNLFDTPSLKYFKILFYFGDKFFKANVEGNANGLLHPTWEIFRKKEEGDKQGITNNLNINYYDYNSAWSYLKMNDEEERAEKLEQFVTLLSNINSESPWYFSSISGLDSAMERKVATDGKLDMSEVKRLQIKCLPDAIDDRIGTLLSLYRDVTWSWSMKKEILPVNLRKFDMAVYVFETPTKYIHKETDVIDGSSEFKPSYRMIEFHNCEFDYNSLKTGYGEVSNQTGTQPTYTIDIMYDDCYEISYNSIMMRTIGDVILTDTNQVCLVDGNPNNTIESVRQADDIKQLNEWNSRIKEPDTNFAEQLVGVVKNSASTLLKRAILGNIYTASLTQIASELKSAADGNIIAAAQTVKQYAKTAQERAAMRNKKSAEGNIYGSVEELVRNKPTGDIFPDEFVEKIHTSRNIYPDNTTDKRHRGGDIFPDDAERKEHQMRDIYSDEVTRKEHVSRDIYPEPPRPQKRKLGNIFNKATIANN